jgi:hypothetical protein
METVVIIPCKSCRLVVDGEYFKSEDKIGLSEQFLVDRVDVMDNNILNILEWANSFKSGTILQEIERLVLEQR